MTAKKNKTKHRGGERDTTRPAQTKTSGSGLDSFFDSSGAKWLFFAVYLVVTIFLFRDFLFSDDMLFGNDTIPDGVYTRKYYKEYHAGHGGIPRWNPFILGGLPFIDAMHGDTFYPGAWLKFFMPLSRALGHKLVWHVLLAGMFMYAFLRTLGLRRDASFLGGLMYMLAPSFVSLVFPGHDAKMYVTAFLPLAFLFLERGMNRPKLLDFSLLGAVMGLLILTSHVQMAYYSYWALGLYFLFRLLTGDRDPKATGVRTGYFVMAVIAAVALGAVQLLPAYAFTTGQSVRAGEMRTGYEYATSWSMHPEEAAGMIVPSFQGYMDGRFESRQDLYWGRNPFKLNSEYHGILPILFAALSLWLIRDRRTWFFLGLSVLSLVYALGANTPFYRLFYAVVPGVKNFRAPGMIIFLFAFAVVVMGARFISSLLDRDIPLVTGDRRPLYILGGILAAAVVVSLMGESFFDAWRSVFPREGTVDRSDAIAANVRFFTAELWRVVILAGAALGGIWLFLGRKITPAALIVLLALVTVVDQTVVDARFITTVDPDTYEGTAPDETIPRLQEEMAADGPFRILGIFAQMARIHHNVNYYAIFGVQAADGNHNNELQSYELYRGGSNCRNFLLHWIDDSFNVDPDGMGRNNFLRAAGVRYVVFPDMQSGRPRLIENPHALDRAFVVHDWRKVPSDTAAVELMRDADFDAAKTALLTVDDAGGPSTPPVTAPPEPASGADFEYTKAGMIVTADLDAAGLVVVSENMTPHWRAFVDGSETPIYRAYGAFMAVGCPAGEHTIEFRFRSKPYRTGKMLSLSAFAFVFVSAAGACAFSRFKGKNTGP